MDACILPNIEFADYGDFKRMPGNDFPDTYEQWIEHLQRQAEECSRKGGVLKRVPITPPDFEKHCQTTAVPPNMRSLQAFAVDRHLGHH